MQAKATSALACQRVSVQLTSVAIIAATPVLGEARRGVNASNHAMGWTETCVMSILPIVAGTKVDA